MRRLNLVVLGVVAIIGVFALVFLFANARITGNLLTDAPKQEGVKYLLHSEGTGDRRTEPFFIRPEDLPVIMDITYAVQEENSGYSLLFADVKDAYTQETITSVSMEGYDECKDTLCFKSTYTWLYETGQFYVEVDETNTWRWSVHAFTREK